MLHICGYSGFLYVLILACFPQCSRNRKCDNTSLGALGKKRIGERIAEWRKAKGGMGKKECEENVAETAGRRPSNTEH